MTQYYDIWPMDGWAIEHACQMIGLNPSAIKSEIIEKYRNGTMRRNSDGPFYLKNIINQALRDRNINVRMG